MKEVERIAEQLRRAYEGEAWHGPSVKEALEGVTPAKADARPLNGAHSIREIVNHMLAGADIVRRRLEGERSGVTEEEWWPQLSYAGEESWGAMLEALHDANAKLRAAIAALDDERLDTPIAEGMSTIYITLHGLIQHDLYHAGQIMLLKKA
jgi:uncharacterized damage-inducible protein DinB